MIKLLKKVLGKGKPAKWVLKARNADTGEWEVVAEYDAEKSLADVRELIDELRNEGYDMFRMDVYDANGNYLGRKFTKSYAVSKSIKQTFDLQKALMDMMTTTVQSTTSLYKTQLETLQQLTELIKGNKPDSTQLLAELLNYELLKREVLNALGIPANQINAWWNNPVLNKFLLEVIPQLLSKHAPDIAERFKELYLSQSQQQTTTSTPTAVSTQSTPAKLPPPPDIKLRPEVEKLVEDVEKRVADILTPPCMKGMKCLEGEA